MLRPGDRGFCFVRENREGEMVLSTYGRSTGFCIDPIEKKPLNHFFPGTSVLSFGTAGCNLGCKFCQNWSISKSREIEQLSESASPEAVAQAALQLGCRSVAFTYNDPVVWAEYAIDTARACRAVGVKTVAVTAGYIAPAARGPFFEYMDAANVDLKAFNEDFYRHVTSSHLQPVLETLEWLKRETEVWFEITNLVIPQANDSTDEIRRMCQWIVDRLGPDVPLHFTAFHPDFRMTDRGRTPTETLLKAREIASSLGINYVYTGNIQASEAQSTYCPGCKRLLIERNGYELGEYAVALQRCEHCGSRIAGRFDATPGDWGSRRQPVRISAFTPTPFSPSPLPALKPQDRTVNSPSASPSSVAPASSRPLDLSHQQQQAILHAAGRVVAAVVRGEGLAGIQSVLNELPAAHVTGAFVTLKRTGRLRSCCGMQGEPLPLVQALTHAATRAANDDPRFPPISPSELAHLELEVSLLHGPREVAERGEARREAVVVGKHGLQIARGEARGLLLPVVAVEHKLDAEAFLQHVCLKAGLPPTTWKEDDVSLWTFEGQVIGGNLSTIIEPGELAADGHASPAAPLSAAEVAALADFCRENLSAIVRGATPSYYAFGIPDANVNGVAAVLRDAAARPLLESSKWSLRQAMPLQATLYHLIEDMAGALGPQGAPRIDECRIELLILFDPAVHGTLSAPDLNGFDPRRRALLAIEGAKSAAVFSEDQTLQAVLDEASELAQSSMPEATLLFSFAAISSASRVSASHAPRPQVGVAVRPPAVAGTFYPSDAQTLADLVDELLDGEPCSRESWPAVMLPHAGLRYSGRIAAETLRRVDIPDTVIVLGPKHTPLGVEWAVAPHQAWSIPGATIASAPELARQLVEAIPGLELDAAAHQQEHAIEVELPLLAKLAPQARVMGIAIGGGNLARCRQFAARLAQWLRTTNSRPLLIVSSDMNHFASDAENRRLDELALTAMETLDPERLYETVTQNHISMCGLLPAVIVLETLRQMGLLKRSQRVAYATSADVTGDRLRVVGYAGMLLG